MSKPHQTAALLAAALFASELGAQVAPWTDDSPHEVRFVTIAPDVQLEVLDWGGTGEALVFVAGLSQNAHTFDDFASRFTGPSRIRKPFAEHSSESPKTVAGKPTHRRLHWARS